jgi:hypothetical protein
MDGVLVGVSGRRTRCALPDLTREAEMPQNPRSEPVGSLAQLLLPGLGLVGVGEPNRSRGAGSPTPGHTKSAYLARGRDLVWRWRWRWRWRRGAGCRPQRVTQVVEDLGEQRRPMAELGVEVPSGTRRACILYLRRRGSLGPKRRGDARRRWGVAGRAPSRPGAVRFRPSALPPSPEWRGRNG